MENIVLHISAAASEVIQFMWLPIVIWTVLSIAGWLILRSLPSLHPQYHYHMRLAMLLALPAGLIALTALQGFSSLFMSQSTAEASLKFVTFTAPPIEITLLPETTAVISMTEWLYFGIALIFGAGMTVYLLSFAIQWIQMIRLKNNVQLFTLQQAGNIDKSNLELAASHPRIIRTGFLEETIIPVTFGYRNPVILLPATLRNDNEKLNLAVRHELTHISQNDFITHSLVLVTQLFFWYHPFIHMFKKELVDYREMRCDTLVLSGKNVSPKKYASLLLELLPMTNVNKELSVNMAQETSNLKKRIQMIAQHNLNSPIPKRASLAIFAFALLGSVFAMACTDLQTHDIYDREELDIITDFDMSGERDYHQILIFMRDQDQAKRNLDLISQLEQNHPGAIYKVDVYRDEYAREHFGERGAHGVIRIHTHRDADAFNEALQALGLETIDLENPPPPPAHPDFQQQEDYYVVAEEMPELIGGLESIMKDIRYPSAAREAGIQGRVYIQFIVNEQGEVESPRVIRGIGGGADEEALRVVNNARFTPGMQRGEPVRVLYTLPIFFRLATNDPASQQSAEVPEGGLSVTGYSPDATASDRRSVEPELIRQHN